ncbi:hypothetical protein LIA77_11372 [Sarocladium implicatum]|nr:hypothetical protein LIA77_11372 [Sarocladium implicatum]
MPDEDSVYYRRSPSEVIQEHYQTRPMITARHSDSETATATPTTGSRITSPTVLSQVSEVAQHRAHTESIYEIDDENLRMPSLEELKLHGMQEEKVECIFVDGCATNSPVRKSVSHFFGRNKGTTLQIPEHIWLVYCRQHYQRLRYRLGQNYALHQLDLVKVVIHRIERWGKENKAKNDGDEVLDWQIMLRKCVRDEQERWTRFKQDLRRQGLPQHEQDEKYETFKASRVGPSKYQRALGRGDDAGPDAGLADISTNNAAETLHSIEKNYPWLLDTLGDHKSADEVINVINRLRHDYKEAKDAKTPGGVSVIKELPPIEFLPNLSNDNEDRPVKAGRKRGPARAARATEAAKRRATRFGESPNNAVDAGHYSHSEFDPRMTPSQMGYWPNRTGVQHVQERDTSKPSYIVPHMQPLNYGYRSTTGPSSDVANRDVLPPATSQPALGRSDPTRQLLPTPRPSHHRSASAFTLGTRFTPISERPSSSGEGAAPGRAYDQGDYFTSPAPIPGNRNAYVFGDPNGYQTGPQNRPAPFDFAPRSRPGAWSDSEHQEVPRVATWPSHDSIASVAVGWRPEERIQRGDERQ